MLPDEPTPLHDRPEDLALRARLRAATPTVTLDDARRAALMARISASAAGRLAARRAAPSWLDLAARWGRIAIPTSALAAGIGGLLLVRTAGTSIEGTATDGTASTDGRAALWTATDSTMDAAELVLRSNGVRLDGASLAVGETP